MTLHRDRPDDWRDQAACARLDQRTADELFYSHHLSNEARAAREFCSHCPVRLQCRTYADDMETKPYPEGHVAYGVWAGQSAAERVLRRQERRAVA